MLIAYILLAVAFLGLASSTVFLFLALFGAARFHADARRARRAAPDKSAFPPVSLLKPVHGLDARLKENIESFFGQDYPNYEILFAADEADDPALAVVREVSRALSPNFLPDYCEWQSAVAQPSGMVLSLHDRNCVLRHSGHQ